MALRTTAPAVQAILGDDYGGTASLTGYIQTANVIVDRVVTEASARGYTLTTTEKELIERWLSAHFYCQSDKSYQEKMSGNASAVFQGATKMYLESTLYGQTACRIDPSGALAAIASGQRANARMTWVGKPPSEQIDYIDRN